MKWNKKRKIDDRKWMEWFDWWNAVISGFPQGYGPPAAGGRPFPPSLSSISGANAASPGPGDMYPDGSLPGYTAAVAAAAAAAAGSPQSGNIAALAARVSLISVSISCDPRECCCRMCESWNDGNDGWNSTRIRDECAGCAIQLASSANR